VSDIAEELGEFAVDADWRLALEVQERLAAVSARAVRDCAAKLLRKERRVLGWCLPENGARARGPGGRKKR
jgi:predicted Zn-dependent peptidase